jgi:hypothetical protein
MIGGTTMRSRIVTTVACVAAVALALAACSALPIPATVDLRARMGSDASGTSEVEIGAGEARTVDLRIPSEAGDCIDFSDEDLPVTLESARLHWKIDADYEGPELSGLLQARVFIAGEDDDLFASRHTLGPVFTLQLHRAATRLAGSAVLNPAQLRAINDGVVCWGLEITGRDVTAAGDGTATIRYQVHDLRLSIRFSVI